MLGGGELPEDAPRGAARATARCGATLIAVERASLLALRNEGKVARTTVRRVERDLDLDEARIRS